MISIIYGRDLSLGTYENLDREATNQKWCKHLEERLNKSFPSVVVTYDSSQETSKITSDDESLLEDIAIIISIHMRGGYEDFAVFTDMNVGDIVQRRSGSQNLGKIIRRDNRYAWVQWGSTWTRVLVKNLRLYESH